MALEVRRDAGSKGKMEAGLSLGFGIWDLAVGIEGESGIGS